MSSPACELDASCESKMQINEYADSFEGLIWYSKVIPASLCEGVLCTIRVSLLISSPMCSKMHLALYEAFVHIWLLQIGSKGPCRRKGEHKGRERVKGQTKRARKTYIILCRPARCPPLPLQSDCSPIIVEPIRTAVDTLLREDVEVEYQLLERRSAHEEVGETLKKVS